MKLKLFGLVVLSLLLNSCTFKQKTKLVVVLVADQMRPDHFSRFGELYKGGLKWLSDNGISFENDKLFAEADKIYQEDDIKKAYKIFYRENLRVEDAVERIKAECDLDAHINLFLDSIHSSTRGILR